MFMRIASLLYMLSNITQTGLKLVVLYFVFECDELVGYRLRSDRFFTKFILRVR